MGTAGPPARAVGDVENRRQGTHLETPGQPTATDPAGRNLPLDVEALPHFALIGSK